MNLGQDVCVCSSESIAWTSEELIRVSRSGPQPDPHCTYCRGKGEIVEYYCGYPIFYPCPDGCPSMKTKDIVRRWLETTCLAPSLPWS